MGNISSHGTLGGGRLAAGIFLWLAVVIVLTAVASPAVFHVLEAWGGEYPFARVFNRALMVAAILGLLPLWWFWGKPDLREAGCAWPGFKWAVREGGVWFAVGAASLLAMFFWYLGWDAREWKEGISWSRFPGFLLSGILIGLLEEPLFRGFFFLALAGNRAKNVWIWALASSLFFAATHFLKVPEWEEAVGWSSGWELAAGMISSAFAGPEDALRWSGLFWTGCCLCALAWRQGSLWGAAGLHAGWVFMLKAFHALSDNGERESPFWFAPDLVSGIWTQILLAGMLVWIARGKRL